MTGHHKKGKGLDHSLEEAKAWRAQMIAEKLTPNKLGKKLGIAPTTIINTLLDYDV